MSPLRLVFGSLPILLFALNVWSVPGFGQQAPQAGPPANVAGSQPASNPSRPANGQLPNTAGQVWREYDLRPYTSRVTTSDQPQQAVLDWILRETGTQMWFNQPLGILSADRNTLRVYHTPEIQSVVARIVDQLVRSQAQVQVVGIKLITVGSPNWRAAALPTMQSIQVQSDGVQGWVTSKEHAAGLYNQLKDRGDVRIQSAGDIQIHNGQKIALAQRTPRDYIADVSTVLVGSAANPLVQVRPQTRRIEEGYTLELDALAAADGRSLEVVLDCEVNQIERFQNVRISVPTGGSPANQNIDIQVPQIVSWKLNERFRWSSNQVLVLSCGVVATPEPDGNGGLNLAKMLNGSRGRADALLFLEYKGPATTGIVPQRGGANVAPLSTLQPTGAGAAISPPPNGQSAGLVPVQPKR